MMERDSFHSHSRRISDSYLMHRNRSDLCDQDGNEHHPNIRIYLDDLSRKSSQNSHSHVSQSQHLNEVQFTLDVCAKLDNTDLEGDIRMPTKSLSRMNTHNSCEDEDSPLSQLLENTRRDAVLTLSEKREKKAELVRKESERSKDKTISICKLAKYSISMSFQKFREGIVSISYNLELWYSSLKLIEGNFGSSVASYFRFLRWLFLLNLVTLVISFSFLVVPQILSRFFYNTNEFPDVLKNGGTHTDRTFHDLSVLNGTLSPPLNAAALYQKNNPYAENSEFSITDILTGEGFLTATSMYYGFYKSGTLTLLEGYPYHLAPAYFFSMVVCYLIILIMVSISMASSYRKTFIETQGAHKNSLALKVFCGLDCSVATEEGADLNMKRVFNEIMETLNEKEYKNHNSSFASCVANVAIQITLNSLFVCLMAGIALLMWDLMEKHSVHLSDESPSFINTMTMAVITTLIMNILPMGFSWIVRYEDYQSPRTALFVTLLRTFLLNVVVIGTISLFWLTHLQECWETALGQEVYRLLITDFFISVFVMGLFETLWFFIQRKLRKEQYRVEFDIAWNTLNLIYNETLFLIGFYFSPLLAAVIVIKLFITFYIKKSGALFNCQPPKKSWRAAQAETFFLILTFFSLLGAILVFGYIIFYIEPSKCGPFSGFSFMYEAILQGIFQLQKNNTFWKAVVYLAKPGVIGAGLIAMVIATYILRAKAQAQTIQVAILQNILETGIKDKAFLFKFIKRIEEMNRKEMSPSLSHSSSFRTPLSERRRLRRASKDNQPTFQEDMALGSLRKFHSTSHLAPIDNLYYYKGHQGGHDMDQPSSSSGTSKYTNDIELLQMDYQTSHQYQ